MMDGETGILSQEDLVDSGVSLDELIEINSDEDTNNDSTSESTLFRFEAQEEENELACQTLRKSRIRSKKPNPENWKNNIQIKNRMEGKQYVVKKKKMSENGEIEIQETVKSAKKMGERCDSKQCATKRKCKEFSESERASLFSDFWSKSWKEKQIYVKSCIDLHEPLKRKLITNLEKQNTMKYHLKLDDVRAQVCRNFFLSTLGMKKTQLHNWLNPKKQTTTTTKKTAKNPISSRRQFLIEFFNRLPKVPSHYTRQDSTKSYLEPLIKSKVQLHQFYKDECEENGLKPLARCAFEQVFDELNLSLFHPKKDQCDLCFVQNPNNNNSNKNNPVVQLNQVEQQVLQQHLERKSHGRKEKKQDQKLAIEGKCFTLTVDVQQVKLSPCVLASKGYFKQKIASHNYSVYNLGNQHTMCFWWEETQGGVDASNFSSCLIDYLTTFCLSSPRKPIIIYSDGCASQNRNSTLSNALLHFSVNNNVTVTQKILEKGHTQMQVDSVHSSIEGTLKRENIFLPSDYVQKTKEARHTPFPYEVKDLTFQFFNDYSNKTTMKYKEIRPGKVAKDPKVTDLHVLQYSPDGNILYKLNFSDEFRGLPNGTKSSFLFTHNYPKLYTERLPITDQKYKDLQDLKSVIPAHCHSFYDELPKGKKQKNGKQD